MFEKYKVGTVVRIAKTSGYYGGDEDSSNPKDIDGTITKNDRISCGDHIYWVVWTNGSSNDYRHSDLTLAKIETLETTESYV